MMIPFETSRRFWLIISVLVWQSVADASKAGSPSTKLVARQIPLPKDVGNTYCVVYSFDGKLIATGHDDQILLWDTLTGAIVSKIRGISGHSLGFLCRDRWLVVGSREHGVSLCDPKTGSVKRVVRSPKVGGTYGAVATAREESVVAITSQQGLHVYTIAEGTSQSKSKVVPDTTDILSVAWLQDGLKLAGGTAHTEEWASVRFWDREGMKPTREVRLTKDASVPFLSISGDGATLAAVSRRRAPTAIEDRSPAIIGAKPAQRDIHVLECLTGQQLFRVKGHPWSEFAVLSPDGRMLAHCDKASSDTILLTDVFTGEVAHRLRTTGEHIEAVCFGLRTSRLVTLSQSAMLVYELPGLPWRSEKPLSRQEAEGGFTQLGSPDAAEARKAMGDLIRSPKQSLDIFQARLKIEDHPRPDQISKLILDVGSDTFQMRRKAELELASLGPVAEPFVKRALPDAPTLDVKLRLQQVLKETARFEYSQATLRTVRAIEVLGQIANGPAKSLLDNLARGPIDRMETLAAKTALARLRFLENRE